MEAAPRESTDGILEVTGLADGQPYRAEQVRRAVKVLYQTGRFANVLVLARRSGNLVQLRLVLRPRPFVREVSVVSEGEISAAEIETATGLKVGDELVLATLGDRRRALELALERRGYRSPAIGLAAQRADENGGAELLIRVDEGPKTRLHQLVIRGRPARPLWRIAERIGVSPGDVLDLDRVRNGLRALEREYRADDHYEVKIAAPEIRELSGSSGEPLADLVLDIDAGPEVRIRFKGHQVVPLRELEDAASILRELGVGRVALSEARDRLLGRYERRGHWRAKVEPAVRVTEDRGRAEVLFSIDEGPAARIDTLEFPGNTALDDDALGDAVAQVVTETLGEELERPATDPAVVTSILNPPAVPPPHPRTVPHAADPDPRRLYIERAYRAGADAVADLYRAEGYQAVEVRGPEVVESEDRQRLTVRMPIRPGVRWMLGAVSLSGNEVVSSAELLLIAGIEPGQPLSFYQVESSRRAILAHYKNAGHLYARVDETLREVPPRGSTASPRPVRTSTSAPIDVQAVCHLAAERGESECPVELAFMIREGPAVRARQVIIRGASGTERSLVERELTLESGSLLRESDLSETQRNLLGLGIYQRVTVRPIDEEQESSEKDVLVEVKEGKHHSFEVGAGASTEEGVRVFASYGHNNLADSAIRFQLNGKLNVQPFIFLYDEKIQESVRRFYADRPLEYLAATGFVYPRILGLPRGFSGSLDLAAMRDNDPSFAQDSRTLSLALDYAGFNPEVLARERPLSLQLRFSFDWADLTCNPDFDARRGLLCGAKSDDPSRRFEGTTIYTELKPSASWDFRDDPLNPRAGVYLELQPAFLFGFNEKSPNHMNLRGKLNGYIPIFSRSAIALSLVLWRIFPFEDQTTHPIPVNRRFFAGGRSTIRGYAEQTLIPRDVATPDSGLSPGGLFMLALKAELRFPIASGLEGTLFYDIGDVFDDPTKFVIDGRSRQGAGFGIRYSTPIGPLLLDIAFPLVRRGEELTWVPHFAAVGSF
ncbi:MAG: BamA/TamA family outer membrane protein [Deltaproteobacteria bacterium]|nr:BamA/TamA family outer membrane protein [Deltaproteobacteria bacterium]